MLKHKNLLVAAGIVASFIGFVALIVFMSRSHIINFTEARLMLVALFGLYVGFGILIAVYRVVSKLE